MLVEEVMTPVIVSVDAEVTAAQAAAQMKALDVGLLGVMRDGELYGVVTDRDITLRAVATGLDPAAVLVRELTSLSPRCCRPDASLEEAASLMARHRVRRLLVRDDDGPPVGILSLGDLAAHTQDSGLAGDTLARIAADS
jgi:CBS domain-containing protein